MPYMELDAMPLTPLVAREIHASLANLTPSAADAAWQLMGARERAPYLIAARRAIGVMRTPTDEMLADGNRKDLQTDAANVWERMVFRALLEEAE